MKNKKNMPRPDSEKQKYSLELEKNNDSMSVKTTIESTDTDIIKAQIDGFLRETVINQNRYISIVISKM